MYVCMYVCSRNTAKTVQDSTKFFSPPYSPFSCGVQCQVSLKSSNEKIISKSIPDSVKYSSGEFDQCKQPQRYSSLEVHIYIYFYFLFFLSTAVATGTQRIHGSSRILLKLSSCMYVCSRNTAETVQDSAKILVAPYSPFSCGVQYQVSFKSGNEKIIKKLIPDSVNYSSGLFYQCKQPLRYSSLELSFFYNYYFFEMIFFMNRCHNGNLTGSRIVL